MAMKFAGSLVLVLVATSVFATSVFATGMANGCPPCPCGGGSWWPPLPPGTNTTHKPGGSWWPPLPPGTNTTHKPKTVVVGESENWHWGFDYTHWAWNYSMRNPFFVNDTLEFKYTTEHIHTVYLLPDYQSYQNCNITNGKQIGWPGDGVKGVKFTLTAKEPWEDPNVYFACGEGNGLHCNVGMMRFFVFPWPCPRI